MKLFRHHKADKRQTKHFKQDLAIVAEIADRGPGYSGLSHYRFFRHVLDGVQPTINRVLILGVYCGRDLMYIADLELRRASTRLHVVGVDKFSDDCCDDWPEGTENLTWAEAGFGPAPDINSVDQLLRTNCPDFSVELVQSHAESFLETYSSKPFDWIYIDIAHDYKSTKRMIELCLPHLSPGGILSGDDYSDEGTWGVRQAVGDSFPAHFVWDSWIWYCQPRHDSA